MVTDLPTRNQKVPIDFCFDSKGQVGRKTYNPNLTPSNGKFTDLFIRELSYLFSQQACKSSFSHCLGMTHGSCKRQVALSMMSWVIARGVLLPPERGTVL